MYVQDEVIVFQGSAVSQLSTEGIGFHIRDTVVTHSPPSSVAIHLQTAIGSVGTAHQSQHARKSKSVP